MATNHMKDYQQALLLHLARYAHHRLGISEQGTYRDKTYPHILPSRLCFLNFLEFARSELQAYLLANPTIRLHQYFHHLNSSQAFVFNLFFPYFDKGGSPARALSATLGIDEDVEDWSFEYVQDRVEGTNVDVMWRVAGGGSVFCEAKLSENGFGAAKNDARHREKFETIYLPRLRSVVSQNYLGEETFFKNYQLLRNISLLVEDERHILVILLPRENEPLDTPLKNVLKATASNIQSRIKISYVEDCLRNLQRNTSLPAELRFFAASLAEKYIPKATWEVGFNTLI
jgi:hypothetical protein